MYIQWFMFWISLREKLNTPDSHPSPNVIWWLWLGRTTITACHTHDLPLAPSLPRMEPFPPRRCWWWVGSRCWYISKLPLAAQRGLTLLRGRRCHSQIICCESSRTAGISLWERCSPAGGWVSDMPSVRKGALALQLAADKKLCGLTQRCMGGSLTLHLGYDDLLFSPAAILQADMAAERVVKTEDGEKLAKVMCVDGAMRSRSQQQTLH